MTRVRPSITRFDLAVGGYAGVLALVGVAVATGRGFLTRPPLAAAVAVLLVVAGVAATREDLAARSSGRTFAPCSRSFRWPARFCSSMRTRAAS